MEKAPDFTLNYIDRKASFTLSEHLGRPIVLTFWASWCPDCTHDLPLKEKLHASIDSNDILFLTINVTGREPIQTEARKYVDAFLKQPTLVDGGEDGLSTYRKYNCRGVPTTVIINQDGHIVKTFGDDASTLDIMKALTPFI